MPQLHPLTLAATLLSSVILGIANADLVLWTAQGKVTTLAGTFQAAGIQAEDTVGFRMTYDDKADLVESKNVFGLVEADFRKNIHLTVTLTIGESIWSGTVASGSDPLPATLFTRFNSNPGNEILEATLDGKDGGSFSAFPFALADANHTLSAKFTGPNTFLGNGIESLEIDPSVLTSATGFLRSGSSANQVQFTLDPTTVSVIDLADDPFAPVVTLATAGNDLEMAWPSDPRFDYRLEMTSELDAQEWTAVASFPGTGGPISRILPRGDTNTYLRVVAFSKPR